MQSLESVTEEFLKEKKNLEKAGYEVIGTKYDSRTMFLLVRKKDK